MSAFLNSIKCETQTFDPCEYIKNGVSHFIEECTSHAQDSQEQARFIKPVIVMIDDISLLLSMNSKPNEIYQLFSSIDKSLRDRSQTLMDSQSNYFVVQTMVVNHKSPHDEAYQNKEYDVNYIMASMENLSDIILTLKPLNTGYSTRVDGTIKIVDNRLPSVHQPSSQLLPSVSTIFAESAPEIGTKKAFFFKLGDRRVRLTSSALIF